MHVGAGSYALVSAFLRGFLERGVAGGERLFRRHVYFEKISISLSIWG